MVLFQGYLQDTRSCVHLVGDVTDSAQPALKGQDQGFQYQASATMLDFSALLTSSTTACFTGLGFQYQASLSYLSFAAFTGQGIVD